MVAFLFKEQVYHIEGAAMEVHNGLGPGFLEAVYNEEAQIINAIKAAKKRVGVLINFGEPPLYWKRYVT